MFFTRIGKIVAHLIFWCGIIRVGVALIIAFNAPDMETNAVLSRRYLATSTSGEALSYSTVLFIIAAIALGVLCEIAAKRTKAEVTP